MLLKKKLLLPVVSILFVILLSPSVTVAESPRLHADAKLALAAWHQAGDQWLVAYVSELRVVLPGLAEPVSEMALRIYLVQWDGVWGHTATVKNFWRADLDSNEFVWNFENPRVTAEVEADGVTVIITVELDTLPPTKFGRNVLLPVITGFVLFDQVAWRFGTATLTEVEPDGSVDIDEGGLAMAAIGVINLEL